MGAGTVGYSGAIAAEHEFLEVTEEPTLGRGQDSAGAQQVFEACQELLRAGLVGGGQEVLSEPFVTE
jgi:hypothetical protein